MSVSSYWRSFIFTLEITLLYLLSFQSTLHSLLVFIVLCYHQFSASTVVSSSDIPWDLPNDLIHPCIFHNKRMNSQSLSNAHISSLRKTQTPIYLPVQHVHWAFPWAPQTQHTQKLSLLQELNQQKRVGSSMGQSLTETLKNQAKTQNQVFQNSVTSQGLQQTSKY